MMNSVSCRQSHEASNLAESYSIPVIVNATTYCVLRVKHTFCSAGPKPQDGTEIGVRYCWLYTAKAQT